jgi:hypothetical protein
MVWTRAFYAAGHAYRQAEEYLKASNHVEAIALFDRSIRWYAPFNPYVRKSVDRLWEMAVSAELEGDPSTALMALRTIRRGFYSARNLCDPGTDWTEKCDARIRKIIEAEDAKRNGNVPDDGRRLFPSKNHVINTPHTGWSMVVILSFLGWIGSAIGLVSFAFRDGLRPKFEASQLVIWGCCILIFFTLWIASMLRA